MDTNAVNLGTAYASLELRTQALAAGVSESQSLLKQLASSTQAIMQQMNAQMENQQRMAVANAVRLANQRVQAAQRAAEREAQIEARRGAQLERAQQIQAQQQLNAQRQLAAGMRQVGQQMTMAGLAIAGAYTVLIKSGTDWNRHLQTIQANTGITDRQLSDMRTTVENLGNTYGGSLSKIADGWMHAQNLFHTASAAHDITVAGMKAAVATGGDEAEVINILAKTMKEFSIPTSQAAKTMNGLLVASQRGNVTLPQLAEHTDRIRASAANMGIPLANILAMFTTLTQHGLSAAQAETQLVNSLQKGVKPTKEARDALAAVAEATGDKGLVHAFTISGIQAEHFSGLFARIKRDAELMKVPVADLAERLFPNLRGILAGLILTGTGFGDMDENLKKIQDALGSTAQLDANVNRAQEQLAVSLQKLQNGFVEMAAVIAKDMTPGLLSVMNAIKGLFQSFQELSPELRHFIEWGGVAVALGLSVGGRILGLAASFMQLRAALLAVGAAGEVAGAGEGIAAVGGIGAIAGPIGLTLAAVAALAGGIYLLTRRTEEDSAAATHEAQERLSTARAADNHAKSIKSLADEYNRLHAKASPTAEDHRKLQELMNKIAQAMPNLVTGWDQNGNALRFVDGWAQQLARHLGDVASAAHVAQLRVNALAVQSIGERRQGLVDELQSNQSLLRNRQELRELPRYSADESGQLTEVPGSHSGLYERVPATPEGLAVAAARVHELQAQIADLDHQRRAAMSSWHATTSGANNQAAKVTHTGHIPTDAEKKAADDAKKAAEKRKEDMFKANQDILDAQAQILRDRGLKFAALQKEYQKKQQEIQHQYGDDSENIGKQAAGQKRTALLKAALSDYNKQKTDLDAETNERMVNAGAKMQEAITEEAKRTKEVLLEEAKGAEVGWSSFVHLLQSITEEAKTTKDAMDAEAQSHQDAMNQIAENAGLKTFGNGIGGMLNSALIAGMPSVQQQRLKEGAYTLEAESDAYPIGTFDKATKQGRTYASYFMQGFRDVVQTMQGPLTEFFDNLMNRKAHVNPWREFVNSFKHAITQMVAAWAASGIAKLLENALTLPTGTQTASQSAGSGTRAAAAGAKAGSIGGDIGIAAGIASMIPGGQGVAAALGIAKTLGGLFHFAEGGDVPGPPGTPRLAIVHGGERVLTGAQVSSGGMHFHGDMHFHGVQDVQGFSRQLGVMAARRMPISSGAI